MKQNYLVGGATRGMPWRKSLAAGGVDPCGWFNVAGMGADLPIHQMRYLSSASNDPIEACCQTSNWRQSHGNALRRTTKTRPPRACRRHALKFPACVAQHPAAGSDVGSTALQRPRRTCGLGIISGKENPDAPRPSEQRSECPQGLSEAAPRG